MRALHMLSRIGIRMQFHMNSISCLVNFTQIIYIIQTFFASNTAGLGFA
jgi:hypothetical protein